jgi:hypothetical protein
MAEVAVEKVKLVNFADFFLNFPEDDTENMIAEIEATGGSVADHQDKLLNYLRQQRAESFLESGRRFKEKYLKLKAENTIKNSENDFAHSDLAMAYRKKSGTGDDEESSEAEKLELIRKAKGSKER